MTILIKIKPSKSPQSEYSETKKPTAPLKLKSIWETPVSTEAGSCHCVRLIESSWKQQEAHAAVSLPHFDEATMITLTVFKIPAGTLLISPKQKLITQNIQTQDCSGATWFGIWQGDCHSVVCVRAMMWVRRVFQCAHMCMYVCLYVPCLNLNPLIPQVWRKTRS